MNGKKRYEAIIAARTLDPKVESIVVSNDSLDRNIAYNMEVAMIRIIKCHKQ